MIVQVDTPEALYRAPRNSYVASFIDAGTVVRGRSSRDGGSVEVVHPDIVFRGGAALLSERRPVDPPHAAPRNRIRSTGKRREPAAQCGSVGKVDRLVFTGSIFNIHVRVGAQLEVKVALTFEEVANLGEEKLRPESLVELLLATRAYRLRRGLVGRVRLQAPTTFADLHPAAARLPHAPSRRRCPGRASPWRKSGSPGSIRPALKQIGELVPKLDP